MKASERIHVFENVPIRRAVISQIVPAIASQMIALIYNLADMYFVGMIDDPIQTASITIAYPVFLTLTALSNLFGIGGASTIARALGKKQFEKAREVSALSVWGGLAVSVVFSILFYVLSSPILKLCGAKADTLETAFAYTKWVVIFGGPFTVLNVLLANLIRSEGSATHASIGVSLGGIINLILDPLFVLPQFLGMKAEGAGLATAISNAIATFYFLGYIWIKRRDTVLSVHPKLLRKAKEHIFGVLAVGSPSALQYILTVVAVAAQSRFVSNYPTEAIAALGIVKKLDQLPLYFSIGVSSGLLPLLGYNYASGNVNRRRGAFKFGLKISFGFSMLCLCVYEAFAPGIVSLFIENSATVDFGRRFLRTMVIAMPLMSICQPMIIQFQAMGKTKESLICSVLRKGVLDIPLLFILDTLFPLYGCMWVQPIVDTISLIVAIKLYRRICNVEKI